MRCYPIWCFALLCCCFLPGLFLEFPDFWGTSVVVALLTSHIAIVLAVQCHDTLQRNATYCLSYHNNQSHSNTVTHLAVVFNSQQYFAWNHLLALCHHLLLLPCFSFSLSPLVLILLWLAPAALSLHVGTFLSCCVHSQHLAPQLVRNVWLGSALLCTAVVSCAYHRMHFQFQWSCNCRCPLLYSGALHPTQHNAVWLSILLYPSVMSCPAIPLLLS